ncbi:hypothetical protein L596_020629 [Steinernema carpocapsae]|uniref:7TM GPCR serpentine receptor class x (Srx) domain-containing protein n=1 Tax=Steinernema carpocapsae TaxID=34508 RepID=A0A4U5MUV6_STECR|nr:hypothetical protein L596_020629 [Steinernema carpocapsae]
MLAVCVPLKYRKIFTKRTCQILIAFCWAEVAITMPAYFVFPCNKVGYSPTLYEYVFVKCSPDIDRDYSVVGTIVNRFCFVVCFAATLCDIVTLVKIIHIKRTGRKHKDFSRDVRFFCQTSVQNVTMMVALTLIVMVNNSVTENGMILEIFAFCTLIVTQLNNGLALILFNPEVRHRFIGRHVELPSQAITTIAGHRVGPKPTAKNQLTD